MTYTYGDVKIDDLMDGELVTKVERFAGGAWEFIRVTVASGGYRSEAANTPAGPSDWRLAGCTDQDLAQGADSFAEQWKREAGVLHRDWIMTALQGVAIEINRRAA